MNVKVVKKFDDGKEYTDTFNLEVAAPWIKDLYNQGSRKIETYDEQDKCTRVFTFEEELIKVELTKAEAEILTAILGRCTNFGSNVSTYDLYEKFTAVARNNNYEITLGTSIQVHKK